MRAPSSKVLTLLGITLLVGSGAPLLSCARFEPERKSRSTAQAGADVDEQERWVERAGGPKGAKRCFDAIEELETSNKPDRVSTYAEACGAFYSEPACAEAVRALPLTPEHRRATLPIAVCRDAYCPKLPDPRPKLCQTVGQEGLREDELLAGWDELHPAILALDATRSPEASELFSGLARRMAQRYPTPTSTVSSSRSVTILLSGGSGSSLLALLDMTQPFIVPEHAKTKDFDALVSAATGKSEAAPNVSIVASEEVPHRAVIQLMDALTARGATKIRFGNASKPPAAAPRMR